MATQTVNNGFEKPDGTDYVQVAVFNRNADLNDDILGKRNNLKTVAKNYADAINEALQAGSAPPPYPGENGNWWIWDAATSQYVDSGKTWEGEAAGFGEPTAIAHSLPAGSTPTIDIDASGDNTAKIFGFEFGIPKGDKGDTGMGLTVLGRFDTLAQLIANVPSPNIGDVYSVGFEPPFTVFIWDGQAWIDHGKLQGAPGPNNITTSTTTDIAGLLKGEDGQVNTAFSGIDYAVPVVTIAHTIAANAWQNNIYDLTNSAIKANSPADIKPAQNYTNEQRMAGSAAQMVITEQVDGRITLMAQTVPAIDLPVLLEIRSGAGKAAVVGFGGGGSGGGNVRTVAEVGPDENGNVPLTAKDVGAINDNHIINSNFENPVNQDDITTITTTGSTDYIIDMWKSSYAGTYTVDTIEKCLTCISTSTAGNAGIWQSFEFPLMWANKEIVISAYVKSDAPWQLKIENATSVVEATFNPTSGYEWKSITATISTRMDWIMINFKDRIVGQKMNIKHVKLEIGNAATLYEPPIFSDDLERCQRYKIRGVAYFPIGYNTGTWYYVNQLGLPVPMRLKTPSYTVETIAVSGVAETIDISTVVMIISSYGNSAIVYFPRAGTPTQSNRMTLSYRLDAQL